MSEELAYGEFGAPPCPTSQFTDQELQHECDALVGHLVVVQSSPANTDGSLGAHVNWVGELSKGDDGIFYLELSDRHKHLKQFSITHFPQGSQKRSLPEAGRKYHTVIRFTVWATMCMKGVVNHFNNELTQVRAQNEILNRKVSELTARLDTTAPSGQSASGRSSFFVFSTPAEASLTDSSNWGETIRDHEAVGKLLFELDSHYGVPSGMMAQEARNSLRHALMAAMDHGENWAGTHSSVCVNNAFVRYRVCMQAKGREVEVLKKMAPECNDPLGVFIAKNTAATAAAKNVKCYKCGKMGHYATTCYSKPAAQAKNATGAQKN